jgi:hypothetical protein
MNWIEELKSSLIRAGDHIAPDVETHVHSKEVGNLYTFKLFHELPKGSKRHVSEYIRLFAEEHGVKARVTHKRLLIQILVSEDP